MDDRVRGGERETERERERERERESYGLILYSKFKQHKLPILTTLSNVPLPYPTITIKHQRSQHPTNTIHKSHKTPTSPARSRLCSQTSLPTVVARCACITLRAVLQPLPVAEGSHRTGGSQGAPLGAVASSRADITCCAISGGGVVRPLHAVVTCWAQAWGCCVAWEREKKRKLTQRLLDLWKVI